MLLIMERRGHLEERYQVINMSSRLIQEGLKALLEDIGPKTSKQSIRPYMKNAVRGLREN